MVSALLDAESQLARSTTFRTCSTQQPLPLQPYGTAHWWPPILGYREDIFEACTMPRRHTRCRSRKTQRSMSSHKAECLCRSCLAVSSYSSFSLMRSQNANSYLDRLQIFP